MLMAPRLSVLCEQALKDAGVYGSVDLRALPLELVPLEKDVLSLECSDSYASIFKVSRCTRARSAAGETDGLSCRTATSHLSSTWPKPP